jgi:hypothetical protein
VVASADGIRDVVFLHRVTPIISGTRKALVIWATGPDFR